MKGFGFSLKILLLAVTLAAFGLTALLNASWVWTSVVVSVTLLVLLTALLAVLCQPSPRRAFWLGFAMFGWGYLVVLHTPLGEAYQVGSPTTVVLEKAYQAISPEKILTPENIRTESFDAVVYSRTPGGLRVTFSTADWNGPDKNEFHRLGNYLWAWLLALIGGLLSRYFYVAQGRRAEDPH